MSDIFNTSTEVLNKILAGMLLKYHLDIDKRHIASKIILLIKNKNKEELLSLVETKPDFKKIFEEVETFIKGRNNNES